MGHHLAIDLVGLHVERHRAVGEAGLQRAQQIGMLFPFQAPHEAQKAQAGLRMQAAAWKRAHRQHFAAGAFRCKKKGTQLAFAEKLLELVALIKRFSQHCPSMVNDTRALIPRAGNKLVYSYQ